MLLDTLLVLALILRFHNCNDRLRFAGRKILANLEALPAPDPQAVRLARMTLESKNPKLFLEMILQGAG